MGAGKPYNIPSFTFKFLFAATSLSDQDKRWYQEIKATPEDSIDLFNSFDPIDMPDPVLFDKEALKNSFVLSYQAGQVDAHTFVGRKGVPAYAWPSLERFDATHLFRLGAPDKALTNRIT